MSADADKRIGPLQKVRFSNGIEIWMDEDGRLHVFSYARGQRGIAVLPRAENSCEIEVRLPKAKVQP